MQMQARPAGPAPGRGKGGLSLFPGRRRLAFFSSFLLFSLAHLHHDGRVAGHPAETLDRHLRGLVIADLDLGTREKRRNEGKGVRVGRGRQRER
jgi:hypothetical protein